MCSCVARIVRLLADARARVGEEVERRACPVVRACQSKLDRCLGQVETRVITWIDRVLGRQLDRRGMR